MSPCTVDCRKTFKWKSNNGTDLAGGFFFFFQKQIDKPRTTSRVRITRFAQTVGTLVHVRRARLIK